MKLHFVAIIAAIFASASWAQAPSSGHTEHHSSQPTAGAEQSLVDGEVRKVDKEAGKLTLKHAPIPALDMPDMTMVFRVKDPAMLDRVKVGDKVKFAADKVNGVITVTSVEVVK